MSNFRRRAICFSVLHLAAAGSALAQQESSDPGTAAATGIGEIVVTAQRRAQSILDVPLAITAIDNATLEKNGISNSAQLATAVPNLQISSPYGNTQPNFSLRGISVANEYNSNQASPIGVYIDDVYIAPRTSQGMGLFDLDRVEVLRGPQGTLFGRNTTGGAINFITRGPSLEGANGYAELGYGNFNTFTAQGAVEETLIQGQLGIRVAGNWVHGGGQIENIYPGGANPNSQDSRQGRISLRYKPGDGDLDIKIRAYAGRDNPTQAAVHGFLPARQGLSFFQVDENRIGENQTSASGMAANVSYAFSRSLSVTSITSIDIGRQDLQQAADGSPVDILDIDWQSHYRQYSEEARFNYGGDRLNLVGGLYYGWDQTTTDNTFNIGSVLGPGVNGGFFQNYRQRRHSSAVFLQGDFKITNQWIFTLGARYTEDRARYDDGYANLFVGNVGGPHTPLASTVPCPGVPGTCAYDPAARYVVNGSNDAPTGRAALSYTFDSGLLTYASYNRGYRSGAFNGGGYTSSSGITYIKPETINAYEIGGKGRFLDRALTASAAIFYYDYTNQQLQDTRPGPVSFLVNAPKSQVYGAEAEATYRVVPALTLRGSFGYLHATYKDLTLQGTDLQGNHLPFAPTWTGQFGFDWNILDIAGGELALSPTANVVSRQYFSPFNGINAAGTGQDNSELAQSGYSKVNASLSWTRDKVLVRAWVDNLFDREVYSYGLDLRGAGFPYNFLVPSTPRTFGISGRYSF
jgi:outer membrane receptor protein involved in Fe transport